MKYEQETSFFEKVFALIFNNEVSSVDGKKVAPSVWVQQQLNLESLPLSDFMTVINVGRGVKRQPAEWAQRTKAQVSGSSLETIVGPNIAFSTNVFQFICPKPWWKWNFSLHDHYVFERLSDKNKGSDHWG